MAKNRQKRVSNQNKNPQQRQRNQNQLAYEQQNQAQQAQQQQNQPQPALQPTNEPTTKLEETTLRVDGEKIVIQGDQHTEIEFNVKAKNLLEKFLKFKPSNIEEISVQVTVLSEQFEAQLKEFKEIQQTFNQMASEKNNVETNFKALKDNSAQAYDNLTDCYNSIQQEVAKLSSIEAKMELFPTKNKIEGLRHDFVNSLAKVEEKIGTFKHLERALKAELQQSQQAIVKELEQSKNEIKDIASKIDDITMSVDLTINDNKRIKNIEKATEVIQGKIETLQNSNNDDIKKLLEDKTVTLKKEFPPLNEDEATIIELAKYGEYISEQLTIAARHYARKRKEIEEIAEERNRHGQELIKVRNEAERTGYEKGKLEYVRSLISNYSDLHALFTSETSELQVLATFLKNQGVAVHEDFAQGELVEIAEHNQQAAEVYASFTGLGTFVVKKPAYLVGENVYQKAVLVPYEAPVQEVSQQPVNVVEETTVTAEVEENVPQSTVEELISVSELEVEEQAQLLEGENVLAPVDVNAITITEQATVTSEAVEPEQKVSTETTEAHKVNQQ